MKRKNRSRFFDDDEELVADILLQVPHIVFQSESRLPFNWGFRRTRSAIDRSLPSHPKRKRTKLSYKKKKEDRLNTVDGLTHQREFLKSEEMENVTGLRNTLTAVKSETKLNPVTVMAIYRVKKPTALHLPLSSLLVGDQNNKRIVLALQSGLKSELGWAINALTLLSFKEKDDVRKDATPLAKIPGLLDALLQIIDDWRDIALPKELAKTPRARLLGANSSVTGFGNESEALGSNDGLPHPGSGSSISEVSVQKNTNKLRPSEWWLDEDGLFNLDEEGSAEKQQCAVAASNIIRNFSFMPDNEVIMAQHRHCLETVFQCIEDHITENEELVTNALETIVNLAPLLDLRIFSSSKPSYIKITEKRAVEAIMGMLGSAVKAWHCAAAEFLGRLIINPDNEQFLLPFAPQIHKRLVDLLSLPAVDAQAAAVGALYNLAEVNMDCRLKLASERWAIDRLLKVIKTPHPVPEVCRKAAMIIESLVSEPQNRAHLLAYENSFAEILFSDGRHSDTFARILYELTSRPNNKIAAARGIWGM